MQCAESWTTLKIKKKQDSYGLQRWRWTIAIWCRRHPFWLVYSSSTCTQHNASTSHQSRLVLNWTTFWFSDCRTCSSPDRLVSHTEQEQGVWTTKRNIIIEQASNRYVCAKVCCDCSYVSSPVSFDKAAATQTRSPLPPEKCMTSQRYKVYMGRFCYGCPPLPPPPPPSKLGQTLGSTPPWSITGASVHATIT